MVSLDNFESIWNDKEYSKDTDLIFTSPRSVEACRRHGVLPIELVFRPKKSFISQGDQNTEDSENIRNRERTRRQRKQLTVLPPHSQNIGVWNNGVDDDDVAQLRFERHEIRRRKTLRQVRREREKIIAKEARHKRLHKKKDSCGTAAASDVSSITEPRSFLPSLSPRRNPAFKGIGKGSWKEFSPKKRCAIPENETNQGSVCTWESNQSAEGSQTSVTQIDSLYDQIEDVLEDREWAILQKSRKTIGRELGNYASAKLQDRKQFFRSLSKELSYKRATTAHQKKMEDKQKLRKQQFAATSAKRIEVIAKRHMLENKEISDAQLKLALK